MAEDCDQEVAPISLSKGHATLIEETYRFGYILATLKREDSFDEDCDKELDELVAEARKAMTETLSDPS